MTDVCHSTGFEPGHRTSSPILRSLSFHGLPTSRHTRASPLNIPGASTSSFYIRQPCRLSASVPVNTDVALSRSLLEQCHLESVCEISLRSSLRHYGSLASRMLSDDAGSKSSPASTWNSPSASSGGARSRATEDNTSIVAVTEFTKKKSTDKPAQRQTSALSAALRGCHLGSETTVAPGKVDRPQGVVRNEEAAHLQAKAAIEPASHRDSHEAEMLLAPLAKPVPISHSSYDKALSPATSCASPASDVVDTACLPDFTSLGLTTQVATRRVLLERLMEHVHATIATNYAKGDNQASTSFTASSNTSAKSSSSQKNQTSRGGNCNKRRPSQNDCDESEDSDEDEDHRKPVSKRSKLGKTGAKMLACPFFKRNPQRYQRERSCVGPGWDTMHRLKEHLYRNHTLPIHCLRCHEVFPSDKQLEEHSWSDKACQRRPAGGQADDLLEGIGLGQERRLRSRKRTTKTEEEKWRDAYRICFPDDTFTPSPYYDIPSLSDSAASGSSELTQYEDFVQTELPRRVRSELNRWLDREMIPLEERLRPQLADMIRDIQLSLLEEFRARDLGSDAAFTSTLSSSSPSSAIQTEQKLRSPVQASSESSSGAVLNDPCGTASIEDASITDTTFGTVSASYEATAPAVVDDSSNTYADHPVDVPFAYFPQDSGPIDMYWNGLGGTVTGSGAGIEDWASCWGNKSSFSQFPVFASIPEDDFPD